MRFAKPTLAIASPVLTFALVIGLLTSTFTSTAQSVRTYTAPDAGGTLAPRSTLAPLAPSGTTTIATLETRTEASKFYRLIELAGLRTRLRRPTDSYTVFAPSNAALEQMPARVSDALKNIGAPIVKKLVRVHLVQGVLTPEQLTDGRELETLDGRKLRVTHDTDGNVLLDGVYRLRDGGQRTTNGIIYSIDQVIAP